MSTQPIIGSGSIYALALRAARLNADGSPMVGPDNAISTRALVSVEHTPEYEEGEEQVLKNGGGGVAFAAKGEDTLKRVGLAVAMTSISPVFHELFTGGTILRSGGVIVGYAAPAVGVNPNPYGFSLEVWSKNIVGSGSASVPYLRWLFPRCYLKQNAKTNEAGTILGADFEGWSEENPNLGNGPFNDWPHISSRAWAVVADTALPADEPGYVAVPVQT